MNNEKPQTRSEAASPEATEHLQPKQKSALDKQADAEHYAGQKREELTQKMLEADAAPQAD